MNKSNLFLYTGDITHTPCICIIAQIIKSRLRPQPNTSTAQRPYAPTEIYNPGITCYLVYVYIYIMLYIFWANYVKIEKQLTSVT